MGEKGGRREKKGEDYETDSEVKKRKKKEENENEWDVKKRRINGTREERQRVEGECVK